jgi:hypothetical protein
MPDGLRPPFYTIVWRYGARIQEEHDSLREALELVRGGEDAGEHSTDEVGDADGWLWRRATKGAFEVSERAPKLKGYFPFWEDE